MKLTLTQLRSIIKTEVKRLGGKGLNEAPRKGLSPKPVARPKAAPRVTTFDGTVGGLLTALQQFDGNMPVMIGEDGAFAPANLPKIKNDDVVIRPSELPITVRGLSSALQKMSVKMSTDMPVMFGVDGDFVPAKDLEIIDFDEYMMQVADGEGESHVCIMSL